MFQEVKEIQHSWSGEWQGGAAKAAHAGPYRPVGRVRIGQASLEEKKIKKIPNLSARPSTGSFSACVKSDVG